MSGEPEMSDLLDILKLYLERQNAALEQIAKTNEDVAAILQEMNRRIGVMEEKLKVVEVLKWVVMVLLALVAFVLTGKMIPPISG